MTITLTPELELALMEEAKKRAVTPAELIVDTLCAKFLPEVLFAAGNSTLDDWELEIRAAASAVEAVTAKPPGEKPQREKP